MGALTALAGADALQLAYSVLSDRATGDDDEDEDEDEDGGEED
jgi:hypothetical protein